MLFKTNSSLQLQLSKLNNSRKMNRLEKTSKLLRNSDHTQLILRAIKFNQTTKNGRFTPSKKTKLRKKSLKMKKKQQKKQKIKPGANMKRLTSVPTSKILTQRFCFIKEQPKNKKVMKHRFKLLLKKRKWIKIE
jgi:hypothetical protein